LAFCISIEQVGALPREAAAAGWRANAWNQDYAWFTKEEAKQFLPQPAHVGQKHDLPTPLIERIARCHLVDNVRGQTAAYEAKHIDKAATMRTRAITGTRICNPPFGDVSPNDAAPHAGRHRRAQSRRQQSTACLMKEELFQVGSIKGIVGYATATAGPRSITRGSSYAADGPPSSSTRSDMRTARKPE
jgi:hypothetical protein